ncbi:Nicotianamine synthase [Massariosphaeria phaeospora]|uniref:Nicotianamine synthase n=1 Tax=Massariosphaeria phaeospora TaxID=100035 RepID=A0A7C8MSQ2_9PLEO|nr:Nicotianamine synthase [Massariosphaeria phaeospora]
MDTPHLPATGFNTSNPCHRQHQRNDTPPSTPNTMASSAHQLADELRSIYHSLVVLPSLVPGEQVNRLLTRLVNLCTAPYSDDLASYLLSIQGVDDLCKQLRPLCATAEGELERHWASRIIEESTRLQSTHTPYPTPLRSKPPFKHQLTTPTPLSPTCRPTPCRLAFLGSGPLPLTSLCLLARYPDARVHNIDRDIDALGVSRRLAERLGGDVSGRMSWACEDVAADESARGGGVDKDKDKDGFLAKTDWRAFQVVFLAALVGLDTQAKLAVLEMLARKLEVGTLVVVRSARGLRGVLYPVLELSDDLARIGYEVLVEVHPWTKVVNSIVILRVKER